MKNALVSSYKNVKATTGTTVLLSDFLKNEAWKDAVLAIRSTESKEIRTELKKMLPAVTVSGTFKERNRGGLESYNGLICLDFDESDNPGITPEAIRATLADYDCVAYSALSVSGKGVFAIVPTNNTDLEKHGRICDFLRTVFLKEGILADPSCKDYTRLRFASYDPQAYYNPDAEVFDAVGFLNQLKAHERAALAPTSHADPSDRTRYKVEQYIAAAESGCNDITSQYGNWFRIGFALASEFGADGERYFHRISQFHPKYDYCETAAKYAELLRSGSGRVRIGTFFRIMNENGIKL